MSFRSWQSTLHDCVARGGKFTNSLLHLASLTQTGATRRFFIKIHGFLAFFLFCCVPVHANTVNAASCSLTDAQNAVNSANNGDTVVIPSGVCSWSGGTVTIPATKGITLSGTAVTITGSSHIAINASATTTTRVTGFIFTGAWPCCGNYAIAGNGSPGQATYRIDHNTITGDVATNGQTLIQVSGNGPGLIDHNTLSAPNNAEIIHNQGLGAQGPQAWVDDVTPGGAQMVFIEDNTFTNSSGGTSFLGCSALQSYYGARTVFRHNTVFFCQVDQHGTASNVGARWWEFYENTFSLPSASGNQSNYADLRAGSGVFFNNHVTNPLANSGGGSVTLREEDTGTWPLAYQIGSGVNGGTDGHVSCASGTRNNSPAYLWGNDASMSIGSGSANVIQGRDFFLSASQPASMFREELGADTCSTTYNYVPFTYPHPLQGASSTPQPPTALAAVVQ